jgi:hypothetical protein
VLTDGGPDADGRLAIWPLLGGTNPRDLLTAPKHAPTFAETAFDIVEHHPVHHRGGRPL